jgi:hypothetical protein
MTMTVYARSLIALLSAACLTSIASAQTNWWKTFGGPYDDEGYSVQQTTDGGYIISGYNTYSAAHANNVYLIKTDSSGDILWTRTYGGTVRNGFGYGVQQTADGGYIIGGCTYYGGFNAGLIKTNASGDSIWARAYAGYGEAHGYSVQQTSDAGYIIAGCTFGPTYNDVYLIKTNASGDTLWTRTYGGANADCANSVQQTADGGYIVGGYTASFGAGLSDFYLIKTNASGDTLWTRAYGGPSEEYGKSVQQTSDGGYAITGYTFSFGAGYDDVYLVKTNASGDTLWTRTYGGTGAFDRGYSVKQTADGGYFIAGCTASFGPGTPQYINVYLIRTDAEGDTLWTKAAGGTNDDWGYSVQQTSDGGYIIAGYTRSFGAGGEDVFLIRTDSLGNVGVEEPKPRLPARTTGFLVRPNPFASSSRVPGHETKSFALSDVTGRHVAVCKGDRIGADLRPGVYFLSPLGSRPGKTVTIIKTGL